MSGGLTNRIGPGLALVRYGDVATMRQFQSSMELYR